jgi:hypothetical protein
MRRRRKKIFSGVALAFAVAAFAVPTAEAKPISAPASASYTHQQLRALELRSAGMNQRYATTAASLTPQQLEEQLRFQGVDKREGLVGRTTTSSAQSSSATAAAGLTQQQLQEQLRFQGVDKRHGLIGRTTTSSAQSSSAPVLASSSDDFSWGDAFAGAGAVVAAAIILVAGFTAMRRRAHPVGV